VLGRLLSVHPGTLARHEGGVLGREVDEDIGLGDALERLLHALAGLAQGGLHVRRVGTGAGLEDTQLDELADPRDGLGPAARVVHGQPVPLGPVAPVAGQEHVAGLQRQAGHGGDVVAADRLGAQELAHALQGHGAEVERLHGLVDAALVLRRVHQVAELLGHIAPGHVAVAPAILHVVGFAQAFHDAALRIRIARPDGALALGEDALEEGHFRQHAALHLGRYLLPHGGVGDLAVELAEGALQEPRAQVSGLHARPGGALAPLRAALEVELHNAVGDLARRLGVHGRGHVVAGQGQPVDYLPQFQPVAPEQARGLGPGAAGGAQEGLVARVQPVDYVDPPSRAPSPYRGRLARQTVNGVRQSSLDLQYRGTARRIRRHIVLSQGMQQVGARLVELRLVGVAPHLLAVADPLQYPLAVGVCVADHGA